MKLLIFLFVLYLSNTIAKKCQAHTWGTSVALNGNWQGQIAPLYENSYFVTPECKNVTDFKISPGHNATYGFRFEKNDDFNIMFSLLLINIDETPMVSKSCLYILTANSPAHADVRSLSYHGAYCARKDTGDGNIFYVK